VYGPNRRERSAVSTRPADLLLGLCSGTIRSAPPPTTTTSPFSTPTWTSSRRARCACVCLDAASSSRAALPSPPSREPFQSLERLPRRGGSPQVVGPRSAPRGA